MILFATHMAMLVIGFLVAAYMYRPTKKFYELRAILFAIVIASMAIGVVLQTVGEIIKNG